MMNPELEKDETAVRRMLASLDPEDRRAALRVLEREALRTAPEISGSGKKKVIPEEPLPKDSRNTLSQAVHGLTAEYLVSLIKRKEPRKSKQRRQRGHNQGGFK